MATDWTELARRIPFGVYGPIKPQEATVPPVIAALPRRAGTFQWSDADVDATLVLFGQLRAGQAVVLGDPETTDNLARTRADRMREQIIARPDALAYGWKVRTHAIPQGEPDAEGKYSGHAPAVSLVKDPGVTDEQRAAAEQVEENPDGIAAPPSDTTDANPGDTPPPADDTPPEPETAVGRRRK